MSHLSSDPLFIHLSKQLVKAPKTESVPARKLVVSKRRAMPGRVPVSGQRPRTSLGPGLTCDCYTTDRVCNVCLSRYARRAPVT